MTKRFDPHIPPHRRLFTTRFEALKWLIYFVTAALIIVSGILGIYT